MSDMSISEAIQTMITNRHYKEHEIVVRWSWFDIQAMHPQWTEDQCRDALHKVDDYVHERIVELGNEVLEQVLYEMVEIEKETEEEKE